MNNSEAIQTIREVLSHSNKYAPSSYLDGLLPEAHKALDQLAKDPIEDAREFAQKMASGHWPNMQEYHDYLVTLIISRDERIRREERERCAWQVDHYVSGRIVEINDLKAAIMGGKQ